MTLVIAHRGDTKQATENTLEAISAAVRKGADGIETDLRLSADGIPFLFHDKTLERLAGRPEKVEKLTWRELREVRLQGNLQIPTLDNLCEIAGEELLLNIELKASSLQESRRMADAVTSLVGNRNPNRFLFSSFNPVSLYYLKKKLPRFRIGMLFAEQTIFFSRQPWARRWLKPYSLHPSIKLATDEKIQQYRREGFEIFVWTVNEENDIQRLTSLGVTGIITDHLELARRIVK
ncbi:MAG: glycerophosphodiester phosphodiesterase [Deltaproteobacteria bacterium]|nr:glycerophosphodiester phosphodiesterase [Deltaproteobacteria bacterium]